MNNSKSQSLLGDQESRVVDDGESASESFAEAMREVGEGSMLGYRLRQQAVLSDFGLSALKSHGLDDLLDAAVGAAADGMRANLAKVLEYRPGCGDLLFRAGIGWRSGVIGVVSLSADSESPAGYAFQTGSPVISNHLETEKRFRTPQVLAEHDVHRAINVLISRGGGPWGVLEVDNSSAGEFEAADLAFLQGLANFIGVAIDRLSAEEKLHEAIDYQKLLVKEASHRVKNSLAMLSGLMKMKARTSKQEETVDALEDASDRIVALAKTHDQLWRQDQAEGVDLALLIEDLCDGLNAEWPHIDFVCQAESYVVPADQAAPFALLVTELATNSAKHAYGDEGGTVSVTLRSVDGEAEMVVGDEGKGLANDFDLEAASEESLGMRLIRTLAKSVGGTLSAQNDGGAVFKLGGF